MIQWLQFIRAAVYDSIFRGANARMREHSRIVYLRKFGTIYTTHRILNRELLPVGHCEHGLS
jgi:hypothetical protein